MVKETPCPWKISLQLIANDRGDYQVYFSRSVMCKTNTYPVYKYTCIPYRLIWNIQL